MSYEVQTPDYRKQVEQEQKETKLKKAKWIREFNKSQAKTVTAPSRKYKLPKKYWEKGKSKFLIPRMLQHNLDPKKGHTYADLLKVI